MWPATAWDDSDWEGAQARGWTVMGRLRGRQAWLRGEAARLRMKENTGACREMTAAPLPAYYKDSVRARWRGDPTVLAFLFAHPDSDAMRVLDARGEYFDLRTGNTWDLFFPGYYQSDASAVERQVGARPVGRGFADRWFFNPRDFNLFREHVEGSSEGRWRYSGGTDLVLVNGWMYEHGDPQIDWPSTISGSLNGAAGTSTATIAQVVERITHDIESGAEDPAYGVGDVTTPPAPATSRAQRDIMVAALGGIAAALGKAGLGV